MTSLSSHLLDAYSKTCTTDPGWVQRLHAKYPLFLSDFTETSILVIDFQKILKYQSS